MVQVQWGHEKVRRGTRPVRGAQEPVFSGTSPAGANKGTLDAQPLADLLPAHLLDGDEIVILAIKPSLWFVLFVSWRWLVVLGLVAAWGSGWGARLPWIQPRMVVQAAVALMAARVGFAMLQWVSKLYVLTNRRVLRLTGIFNVHVFECALDRIQNTFLTCSWYERLFSLGTIGFAVHEQVRAAINRSRRNGSL